MSVIMGDNNPVSQRNRFLPGDLVEVLSQHEILATLDEKGTYEKLPFMPEMLNFCGRTFRVSKEASKTCVDTEIRGLDNTVFLDGLRCDGSNHGGCQRACLIFWKTAWLKRADTAASPLLQFKSAVIPLKRRVSRGELHSIAERDGQLFCQSTQIRNASKPLPWWDANRYLPDLRYARITCVVTAWYDKVTANLKRLSLSLRGE
ncbi:MAG TPA: hypothetical protein VF251_01335 [Pyrinomonadaceae bacterium]